MQKYVHRTRTTLIKRVYPPEVVGGKLGTAVLKIVGTALQVMSLPHLFLILVRMENVFVGFGEGHNVVTYFHLTF